jgi:hypothetical protein
MFNCLQKMLGIDIWGLKNLTTGPVGPGGQYDIYGIDKDGQAWVLTNTLGNVPTGKWRKVSMDKHDVL